MIIHTLRILSFGKFKNKTISFSEGINYIYGQNEAGKSTVMAFIKAMLYGFSGRGADGDRQRYSPWDGAKLAGEMEVTLSGGRRVILRRVQGRTKAQDEFTVLDAVTGEACMVDMEREIGIGEAAFMKTVFIPQMRADITGGDKELTEKLLNLATSGDADTGYEEAKKYLTDEMRNLKHQRGDGGKISELKKEITALSEELTMAEEENRAYFSYIAEEKQLQNETEALREKGASLAEELVSAKAWKVNKDATFAEEKLLAAIKQRENAEAILQETLDKEKAYNVFRCEISDSVFAPVENALPIKNREKAQGKNKAICFMGAGVFALLTILALFSKFVPASWACLFVSVVLLLFGIKQAKAQKASREKLSLLEDKEKSIREELAAFGCSTLKEYTEKRAEMLALDEKIQLLQEKHAFAIVEEEARRAEAENLKNVEAQYIDVVPSAKPEGEILSEMQRIDEQLLEKDKKLATIKGILQGKKEGKRAADIILSERQCKEEALEEAQMQYAALSLASETLEAVFMELSRDFTPRINKKASLYLSRLTGKEETLLLDKKYAVTMGRDEHRSLQSFSGGTCEQAFLAVRLAIASLVLEDANMPVFLDDAFIQYDEKREENAFSLLREIAKEKQVILFSCRKRETENVHIIEL